MGLLDNIISSGQTSDDESEANDESSPLFKQDEGRSAHPDSADPNEDFHLDLDAMEGETKQGKEVHLHENGIEEDGSVYAGEWPRRLFEGARDEPEQPIWVGFTEPDPLQGPREVPIEFNSLFRHVAMFGSTGYGKSTILKNMMIQWAFGDHGFCYIDPKGDDSKELIEILPEDRLDDVIWVEPSPDDFDRVVGINFLDPSKDYGEDGFEKETGNIINDIIPILRDESFWGPRMDEVVRGFLRAMLYLGAKENTENYTLVDLYKLLTDEEAREKFAQKAEQELPHEDILKNALRKFAEIDDSDLGAARRRLQNWVIAKDMQQVIAHTESKVNLTKAVENGKIIVVRTASISDDRIKRGVATVVIRRIWAAIQMRSDIPQEEREPFFLCVDEFDDVVSGESDIGRILSKGRSLRLGTVLANQQPHQLSREVQDDVLGNCNTLLALNPKHPDDARVISKVFDADVSNIINLGRFQICTKIEVNNEPSGVFLTHTFPEYPPRRSREEAHEIISDIVHEYGVPPIQKDIDSDDGKDKFDPDAGNDEEGGTFEVSDDGHEATLKEVLRAIYTAQIRNGGADKFVTVDDVAEVISDKTGASTYSKISNVLTEKVDSMYIEKQMTDNVELRLSNAGQQKAFVQDTGDSASAGKEIHRYLLQLSHETFTRLGYDFEAPRQIGGEQPDGIARPPINPAKEANSAREMSKLMEEFDNEHPHLADLFGYDEISVEAEKSTGTKPKQPIKNLIKAIKKGRTCAFVVPDGRMTGDDDLHYHSDRLVNSLKRPPFIRNLVEREDGKAERHFYNKNASVKLVTNNQRTAVKPDTSNTVWRQDPDTGKIYLKNSDGNEPYAEFDDPEDLKKVREGDFPFTMQWSGSQQAYIIKDHKGTEVEKLESRDGETAEKVLKTEGYSKVKMPLIPELEFPDGEIPDDDQWAVITIPSSDRDIGPRIYSHEEQTHKPLFDNDKPLSSDKILGPDEEVDETPDLTPETEDEDGDEQSEEERPKIASEDKPKSTNEVVKESGEEWTKPEPGDDDYNPAKDNSNFRTGYDEEYTDAEWTGGDAREFDKEGDFDEYTPPSERDNTEQVENEESVGEQEPETDEPAETDEKPAPTFSGDKHKPQRDPEEEEEDEDEVITTEDLDDDERLVGDDEETDESNNTDIWGEDEDDDSEGETVELSELLDDE